MDAQNISAGPAELSTQKESEITDDIPIHSLSLRSTNLEGGEDFSLSQSIQSDLGRSGLSGTAPPLGLVLTGRAPGRAQNKQACGSASRRKESCKEHSQSAKAARRAHEYEQQKLLRADSKRSPSPSRRADVAGGVSMVLQNDTYTYETGLRAAETAEPIATTPSPRKLHPNTALPYGLDVHPGLIPEIGPAHYSPQDRPHSTVSICAPIRANTSHGLYRAASVQATTHSPVNQGPDSTPLDNTADSYNALVGAVAQDAYDVECPMWELYPRPNAVSATPEEQGEQDDTVDRDGMEDCDSEGDSGEDSSSLGRDGDGGFVLLSRSHAQERRQQQLIARQHARDLSASASSTISTPSHSPRPSSTARSSSISEAPTIVSPSPYSATTGVGELGTKILAGVWNFFTPGGQSPRGGSPHQETATRKRRFLRISGSAGRQCRSNSSETSAKTAANSRTLVGASSADKNMRGCHYGGAPVSVCIGRRESSSVCSKVRTESTSSNSMESAMCPGSTHHISSPARTALPSDVDLEEIASLKELSDSILKSCSMRNEQKEQNEQKENQAQEQAQPCHLAVSTSSMPFPSSSSQASDQEYEEKISYRSYPGFSPTL